MCEQRLVSFARDRTRKMNQICFGIGWSPITYHISCRLRLPRATTPSTSLLPTSSLLPRKMAASGAPQIHRTRGRRTSGSSSMATTVARAHGHRSATREAATVRAHTLYLPLPTTVATPLTARGSDAEPPQSSEPMARSAWMKVSDPPPPLLLR
jgi:hypothetical protein